MAGSGFTISDLSQPITSLSDTAPDTRSEDPESLKPRDGLSYVTGDRSQPLWRKTVPQVLAETALRYGARDAAVFPEQSIRWSYSELARKVDDLAAGLLAIGIEPGDRVGIWSPNRPEWLLTQFATARIGAILVTVNPAYRTAELEYLLNKVGCKALVIATAFKSSNYVEMITSIAPELAEAEPNRLSSSKLPFLRSVIVTSPTPVPGMLRFDDLLSLAGPAQRLRLDGDHRKAGPGRSHQHPVHQRHHRFAQGRDAHPLQHRQQRAFRRGAHAPDRRKTVSPSRSRSIIASAWSWVCLGCATAGRGHGLPRRRPSMRRPLLEGRRARKMHRLLWRADHVRRHAGTSRVSRSRPLSPCGPASWPAPPVRSKS